MANQLSPYLDSLTPKSTSTALLATVSTFAVLSTAWILNDYNQWVSFGTGGTPATPSGYWRMTKIRWARFWSKDDMRDPSPLSSSGPKFLTRELPRREGERPKIMGRTMPQRQRPASIPLEAKTKERLFGLVGKFCASHPSILKQDRSKTEGFTADAIYALPDLPGRDPSAKDRIIGNEIAHVHPAENSLHVWLSPLDAREVVVKGWGERFPLSAMGVCHESFVMVYAPRSEGEVDVVEEIVGAGVGFLTGVKV